MKQAVVTFKYEEEKLNAIKQYIGKKDADIESELNEVLGNMYEKYGENPEKGRTKRACSKTVRPGKTTFTEQSLRGNSKTSRLFC